MKYDSTVNIPTSWITSPFYMIAITDKDNVVPESDETNNIYLNGLGIIVPVELMAFTVKQNEINNVVLEWITLSEIYKGSSFK